jgi:hypothetical protein
MILEFCGSLITRETPFTGYSQQLLRETRQNAVIPAGFVAGNVSCAKSGCILLDED